MAKVFVLLMVIQGSYADIPSSAEFNTYANCEAAGKSIARAVARQGRARVIWTCSEK